MGIMAIPIPIQVVSHSFPFPILSLIPIPMGIRWDSHSRWESRSHGHLYLQTIAWLRDNEFVHGVEPGLGLCLCLNDKHRHVNTFAVI